MKRWIFAAAAVALATTVAGPGAVAAERVVVTQSLDVPLWAPMYVARKLGYFKDEGIDLEVSVVRSGPEAMAAVTTGSAQIQMGFPATPINAIAKGHNMRIFAGLTNQFIAQVMLRGDVAQRLQITAATPVEDRIRKLKGLTISTNGANSAADYLLQHLVKSVGMKPDSDISITAIAQVPATLAAADQKRIDGFMTSPPTNDVAVRKHGSFQLIDFAVGEYKPVAGILYVSLTASETWLDSKSDTAARVVRALGRALTTIREKPDEAKEAVRSFFPQMDAELFDPAWAGMRPSFPETPRVAPESIAGILDFMATMEGKPVAVAPEKIYTNRIVDLAGKKG